MVQIIESNRPKSMGQRLAGAFAGGASGAVEAYAKYKQHQQEQQALKRTFGEDVAGLPPEFQQEYAKYALQAGLQKQKTEAELQGNKELIDAIARERKLPPESTKGFTDPKIFEQVTRPQKDKNPIGGLAGTPLTSEESKLIKQVLDANPNATAEELELAFGEAGLVPGRTTNIIESRRRIEESKAKNQPEDIRSQKMAEEQAKADIDFNKRLQAAQPKRILKKESRQRLRNLTKKNVTGKSYEKGLEKLGLTALTSSGRREYAAEVKNQFTDFKEVAGSQLSAAEFFVLSNAYPSPDFSPEANEAILNNLDEVGDILDKQYEFGEKLKKENKGKIPEDYEAKVNERLQEYSKGKIQKIRSNIKKVYADRIRPGEDAMITPDGRLMSVPPDRVAEMIDAGAELL